MIENIVFVSNNSQFGGSEILWFELAKNLSKQYRVTAFVNYDHPTLSSQANRDLEIINRNSRLSRFEKVKNLFFTKNKQTDLKLFLLKNKPNIVVFSLGAPFVSLKEMEMLVSINQKFVTINQLISEIHWLGLNEKNYTRFVAAYKSSVMNYFVSEENLLRFTNMIGDSGRNEVVQNPVSRKSSKSIPYPDSTSYFNLAFVGRFEFYHKGLDLLLTVLEHPEWKKRNVIFNFYGDGPHRVILEDWIERKELNFCKVHSFEEDISEIWQKNQILISPSRFEGKSLSITEAGYYGRCTVATNVGGAMDQIEDGITGYIIPDLTIVSISYILNKVWDQRSKWREMGELARQKYIKEYKLDPIEDLLSRIKAYF